MFRIDHVLYGVRDLDEAAGDDYVELIAVVDRAEVEASEFGRSILEAAPNRVTEGPPVIHAVALATADGELVID